MKQWRRWCLSRTYLGVERTLRSALAQVTTPITVLSMQDDEMMTLRGTRELYALYERALPKENLAKPPGAWQSFDITMRAKTISLVWNGKAVYRDLDFRYGETDKDAFERLTKENASKPPELQVRLEQKDGKYVGFFGEGGTRSGLDGPDRPGPILLQSRLSVVQCVSRFWASGDTQNRPMRDS